MLRTTFFLWLQSLLALALPLLLATPAAAQNQALKLDGNGSYVELPNELFKDLTQATVEVWVKWDSRPNYARVFEFGAPWQSVSVFLDKTTPSLRFNIYPRDTRRDPSAHFTITATNLIRTNEWMHLAAVSGPGGMLLYANGQLIGQHTNTASFASIFGRQSSTLAGGDSPAAAEATASAQDRNRAYVPDNGGKRIPARGGLHLTNYLGRGLSGATTDRDFCGELDEVRVWSQRRSLSQIRENMFKRLSGREEGLVHLWNFDDGTANDACPAGGHGKLMGQARIVASDLGLVAETLAAAPAPLPVPSAVPSAVPPPPVLPAPSTAAWWIAAALAALVLLVAWLIVLLRRSGVGSGTLVATGPDRPLLPAGAAARSLSLSDQAALKERALAELTDFAKQSLVQGLHSQRAALIAAQQQAQRDLSELESRLESLRVPERVQAYEQRIAELERQLETRGEEFRELTQATLRALRQKLEAEKLADRAPRFN
jgi:hypothetical protein